MRLGGVLVSRLHGIVRPCSSKGKNGPTNFSVDFVAVDFVVAAVDNALQ